jgi:hypothetical protein
VRIEPCGVPCNDRAYQPGRGRFGRCVT